jgi:hypothetical protein
VPFSVTLTAQNAANSTVTNFNGTVTLAAGTGSPISPAISGGFSQGYWTGYLTLGEPGTSVLVQADDGLGHLGLTSLDIVAAPTLAMQVYGNTLMMLWPASAPALKLETTTNLASPSWTPMPAPLLIGDQFVVPASMTDQSRFYRLHYSP